MSKLYPGSVSPGAIGAGMQRLEAHANNPTAFQEPIMKENGEVHIVDVNQYLRRAGSMALETMTH